MLKVDIKHPLADFALDVEFATPAGLTVLYGASGAGKTTVIHAIAGLIKPATGSISIGADCLLDTKTGVSVPSHQRRVGYVFQEARLFPHLSVRRNLLYGSRFAPRQDLGRVFNDIVELLGVGALLERRPVNLSGGERQRIALGRALLAGPRILLADEPLAALDDQRKAEIMPYFERLRDELDVPVLYVSHSATEVARLATTVVVMDRGRVVQQGPALEVLADPELTSVSRHAAGAVLEAQVVIHHDDGLTELDAHGATLFAPTVSAAIGNRIRLRIPAHEVLLATSKPENLSALNVLPGEIEQVVTQSPAGAMISVRTQAGRLLARVTDRTVLRLGLREGVACFAIVKSVAIAPEASA